MRPAGVLVAYEWRKEVTQASPRQETPLLVQIGWCFHRQGSAKITIKSLHGEYEIRLKFKKTIFYPVSFCSGDVMWFL
jgi:hypothetical protein